MPIATQSTQAAVAEPNSLEAVRARVAAGQVPWAGPLLLVIARSFLLIAAQALVALFLHLRHWQLPWREAGHYWNVYGTLADIGCLIGLRYFTRREGIRLRDLLGPVRPWRDVLLGPGYFLLVFPFFFVGGTLAHKLLFSATSSDPGSYLGRITYRRGLSCTA